MVKKQDTMTTIRVTKETAGFLNDIKRMLELTLGREATLEDVVRSSAEIAYRERLESLKALLVQGNSKD